jgi:hypothetical protein
MSPQTLVRHYFLSFCLLDDLRKHLGVLIQLSFSIISSDSVLLKKAGFSLLIVIIKLFKQCIEKIRDEDDEDEIHTKDKLKLKIQ